MSYFVDIPGFMSENELLQIAEWAKQVPKNGIIVEFGSLYGRSSVCWAMNCDPSVTIYCIDSFHDGKQDCYDIFIENTKKYKNIVPIRGISPHKIKYPGDKINLFFMDAAHTNPYCVQNIEFYKQFMQEDSIMCGHDYSQSWPDVVDTVNKFSAGIGKTYKLYEGTSLWEIKV
jgi:predicted O-methyltransferase YrrM